MTVTRINEAKDISVASGALTAGLANAFAFAWQNPHNYAIMAREVVIDRTTAGGTATSVLDVAVVADATSTGDTIIDGLDLNATGVANNIINFGTNGTKLPHKVDANGGTNDFITGKILVANASALVGKYYIFYTKV